jgi:phosphoribosylglycinamide formyltransferase-1
MSIKARIAIFASGSGSNAEQIIRYFAEHSRIEVVLILSNNPKAFVLERARSFGIPVKVFDRATFSDSSFLALLEEFKVTHLVLAGFLWLIPEYLIKAFPNRIINIHPALLPNYGGKGMYGMKVHEAVKAAGDTKTGITIHYVNEKYDSGRIIFQDFCVVESSDTPEIIAEKVHALEHKSYPGIIENTILLSPPDSIR